MYFGNIWVKISMYLGIVMGEDQCTFGYSIGRRSACFREYLGDFYCIYTNIGEKIVV